MKKWLLSFGFILVLFSLGFGAGEIVFKNEKINIGQDVSFLVDTAGELTIDKVMQSDQFTASTAEVPNFQITNFTFWIKFQVKNLSSNQKLILEVANPIIDELELFTVSDGKVIKTELLGEVKPFKERTYNVPNFLFELNIDKNQGQVYYLRVRSNEQLEVPMAIGTKEQILVSTSWQNLVFGIYYGIMLVMVLYNFFVYWSTKDNTYLYYIFYVFLVALLQACIHGHAFKYLWPGIPVMAQDSMFILPCISGIAAIVFIKNFLRLREVNKKLLKVFHGYIGLYAICLVLGLIGMPVVSQQIIMLVVITISFFLLYVGIKLTIQGNRSALFFLIAWSSFLVALITFVLVTFGVLPRNQFTLYILEVGSALEAVLLSFALADKINTYKKQRLQAIEEKEQILLEQNVTLERKVNQRTKELKHTLEELKSAQSQLIQVEKMASLGLLTAGIAHEINNPLNYMSQSVEILKEDIKELKSLGEKYDSVMEEQDNIQQKIEEVENYKSEIQVDTIYEEVDSALADIEDGITRTSDITKGLKTFSRLDEAAFKKADIKQNLESTLQLMKHELASKDIIIEKKYDEKAMEINCNSGQLNQVFVNLLSNSIYAIDNREHKTEKGSIKIHMTMEKDELIISFEDNGMGMSEETKKRIFDPFYTNKDVGEGTGLGMSIVHGIVDSHNGKIEVVSEVNQGSKISIHLPV